MRKQRLFFLGVGCVFVSCGQMAGPATDERLATIKGVDAILQESATGLTTKSNFISTQSNSELPSVVSRFIERAISNINADNGKNLKAQGIRDMLHDRCYAASGDTSDPDLDGIPTSVTYRINCAWGDAPGRNWVVFSGYLFSSDQNSADRLSGFTEGAQNLQATYYDSSGITQVWNYNTKQTVTKRQTALYDVIYSENNSYNNSQSTGDFRGNYTPSDTQQPFKAGALAMQGNVATSDVSEVADYYVSASKLTVSNSCDSGIDQGTVYVAPKTGSNTTYQYQDCRVMY